MARGPLVTLCLLGNFAYFFVVCGFFLCPGSNSGNILFLPCLFVGLFVGWTPLTLVITFELFEIEPSYLAGRFLATWAFHSYKTF